MDNKEIITENETESKLNGVLSKVKKSKKIRNELLFKKGGVSIAITAIFIAIVIAFNVLVGVLSDRFVLEYDFSKQKVNSLSKENIDYIKKVDKSVRIMVCSTEDSYYMDAANVLAYSSVQFEDTKYFEQTLKLLKKYAAYNKKIDLQFYDTNTSEFLKIREKYGDKISAPGDIIVTSKASGEERVKVISAEDIYEISSDDSMASYGYQTSVLTGNNIENALTGAISYVVNSADKRIAFLTGHSGNDYTDEYAKMLKENNYSVEKIGDKVISKLPSDYSTLVIPVPTVDFAESEIDVLSEFLENDGKYGKGLIVFADASAPYLPVLYDFLDEWGMSIEEGKVFETQEGNFLEDDPTILGSTNDDQSIVCITGSNVPVTASKKTNGCTVTPIASSFGTTIAVPKDTPASFNGFDKYEKKVYNTAITSEKGSSVIDAGEKNPPKSYVSVFSSSYFLKSNYNEYPACANKNLTLEVAEKSCGVEESDILFVKKSITNESFADKVTESKSNVVKVIFIFIIPLAVLAMGIFVYYRRRNAA